MWAGSVVLRLGPARDVLVAVQADSDSSLATLRNRFADWLDDEASEMLVGTNPAFKVHLTPSSTETRGIRAVPHLRHGAHVLIRSADPDDVLRTLASVLGGIHVRRPSDGRAWIQLRLFVRDGRAVLADVARPHLVVDRSLASAGISEAVSWGFELADGLLHVPPPLPITSESGSSPAAPSELEIAGVVVLDAGSESSPASLLSSLAVASIDHRWFDLARRLVAHERVRLVADRRHAVEAIQELLDGA